MRQYVLKPKYLKIGTLFTGVHEKTKSGVGVVLENDRITRVEPVTDPDPKKYRIYDYSDKFVMPSLMDTYVHLFTHTQEEASKINEIELAFLTEASMARYLDVGVTYIRVLGSTDYLDVKYKAAMEKKLVEGANISSCGPEICMTGGYASRYALECDGETECRKATRMLIKNGVDNIKVMVSGGVFTDNYYLGNPQFSFAELQTIVSEAHAANRKVVAHAQERDGIYNSVKAGVNSVEFGNFLDEECAELMVEKGTYFVPALTLTDYIINNSKKDGVSQHVLSRSRDCFETQVKALQLAYAKGVKLAIGSGDGFLLDNQVNLVSELELMTRYGVRNEDALKAATVQAAGCLGIEKDYGSVEIGKKADLLVLNKNPLRSISHIEEVYAVFKDGKRIRFNG